MKIFMILEREFPPDTRVENEIEALLLNGHNVTIACYTMQNRTTTEIINNYKIIRKPISSFLFKMSVGALKLPFYFNFWRKFLFDILNKELFDVIHIHDLPLTKIGTEIKNKYNIPVVIDLHENWPAALKEAKHTKTLPGRILSSNRQWRKYEKYSLQKADKIIAVIEEMKDRLVKLGINEEKIIVVPNTLKIKSFKTADKTPDTNYITLFYAGGINIHRGLQIVIDGLLILKDNFPEIRLWIVGSGSYSEHLKKKVRRNRLDKNVTFFGWKNLQEIADLLARSDIGLIPHLKSVQTDNSSPNKLYQYMYLQKPVIASNCASVERIVKDSDAGLTYQYNSPEDFAKIVEMLILNENKHKFGENGKKAVLEKYNWETSIKSLIEYYSDLGKDKK